MSGQALSEAAMLQSLRDIRLPAEAAGGVVAEILVAIGLGALAAVLVILLVRLVSERRSVATAPAPGDALPDILALPEAERRIALLHFLRRHAPQRFAALRGQLYRADGGVDLATLEAEAARGV